MKYKEGDKVRVHSKEWYDNNKSRYNDIECGCYMFCREMSDWCGKVVTIANANGNFYHIREDDDYFKWTDEMFEGLVEEETPKFKIGDKITNGKTQLTILKITSDRYIVEDNFGECGTLYFNTQDGWKLVEEGMPLDKAGQITDFEYEGLSYSLPNGYIFKDENGNVINATKIVLEKKKKEYPKTYEECLKVLNIEGGRLCFNNSGITQYERDLYIMMNNLSKLLICRDAYWKIAGEEMGLGKPNWEDENQEKYIIGSWLGTIQCLEENFVSHPFAFPTEEMRDAFKENFDPDIEICKEFL